jgi:hypothetical protein
MPVYQISQEVDIEYVIVLTLLHVSLAAKVQKTGRGISCESEE